MKKFLVAIALGVLTLMPTVASAQEVSAGGQIIATGITITPLGMQDGLAKLRLQATAIETGTLNGTSVADNTCYEKVSTGQASCTGPEVLTGTIAGRTGQATFFNSYQLNFNTGVTSGVSSITSSTVNASGLVSFTGNAFNPSGLPYTGTLSLH